MKVFLASAAGVNVGDDAIQQVIVYRIKQKFPGAEITVTTQRPRQTQKALGVKAVAVYPSTIPEMFSAICQSDIVVIGGGTLIQDRLGMSLFHGLVTFTSAMVTMAKLARKPVMLFSVGVDPLVTRRGRWCTKNIIGKVDLINVRDEESKAILEEIGVTKCSITTGADPALLLEPCEFQRASEIVRENGINPEKLLVVVSVVDEIWKDRAHKQAIACACDYLVEYYDAQLLFIPFDYRLPEDMDAIHKTIGYMESDTQEVHILGTGYSPPEIMAIIGQADLAIGMRMHFLLFGALMNVPIIGVSRAAKIDSFLKMLEMKPAGSVNDISGQDLIIESDSILNNRDAIKKWLSIKMPDLTDRAQRAFDTLDAFLSRNET